MNTKVHHTSVSCDILITGCFCLQFSHIMSNLYFTNCTEWLYNSKFVMFFFSDISGTSNCSSAQLLIVYSIRKRKKWWAVSSSHAVILFAFISLKAYFDMSPTIVQSETAKKRFFLKDVCYVQISLNTFPFVVLC